MNTPTFQHTHYTQSGFAFAGTVSGLTIAFHISQEQLAAREITLQKNEAQIWIGDDELRGIGFFAGRAIAYKWQQANKTLGNPEYNVDDQPIKNAKREIIFEGYTLKDMADAINAQLDVEALKTSIKEDLGFTEKELQTRD